MVTDGKIKRLHFSLSEEEMNVFRHVRCRNDAKEAWHFWQIIADRRGVDYTTILSKRHPSEFTALPVGHGTHWCYPDSLRCSRKPSGEF